MNEKRKKSEIAEKKPSPAETSEGRGGESETALREERILKFWRDNKIFEKTLSKDSPKGEFVFYDGPPFATGLPHYGHILAGTIKDVIPRYKTMKGYRVRRQWGWDCHGLPLENEIEKELGFKTKKEIEEYGIDKFNEKAKEFVLRYASDWQEIVPRLGRWVDMSKPYKTMDTSYAETVLWIFKELFKKGLIYEGFKSMHLCPRCETTLSNFEVNQGYKDTTDLAVTVKFELVDEPGTHLLAWTTTPWTLPGNAALAVGPEVDYVKVEKKKENSSGIIRFIIAKERLKNVFDDENYEIKATFKGSALVGKGYKPLFDYYVSDEKIKNKENAWKIYSADFVTTEDGTGVVHIAPAFGEDDLRLGQENNLPLITHIGKDGRINPEVKDFAGLSVKPKSDDEKERLYTDIEIIKYLERHGRLFGKEKITHSYPHCWRCDTPLLNYATSSWFVRVGDLKEKLIEENKKIKWIPEEIGEGRFGKGLLGAPDWAISRSRYWGAPIPVWKCESCGKSEIIGSISDLKEKTKSSNGYFLMRHGESDNVVLNLVSSDKKNPHGLTEKGKKEAVRAAAGLREKKIDVIVASPFKRTLETAEIVRQELNLPPDAVIVDERLSEINLGELNLKPIAEYHKAFQTLKEKFEKTPKGGESVRDLKRRTGAALYDADCGHENKNILFITHEYAAWSMFAASLGLGEDGTIKIKEGKEEFLKTGEVLEFSFAPLPHNSDYELDFHRPYIDVVVFKCSCGGGMRRVPEVFDCWFESGAMPYGQFNYPFSNKGIFNPEKNTGFPADFIAEGLDQTRGWFYTLLVLGAALFDKSPYKNVLVNGLVLAEDGQKMSKRLKNYPDPVELLGKYGADALRLYLLQSPVVRAESLNFSERGVSEVVKRDVLRLLNVVSFYEMYSGGFAENLPADSPDVLDKWIMARLKETAGEMENWLEKYELDRAAREISSFVDDLSTWYIRRSRDRFKSADSADKRRALVTTRNVLLSFAKLIAPFMPFLSEDIYQDMADKNSPESVHLENWPEAEKLSDEERETLELMDEARRIVSLGLEARSAENIKVRQPLSKLKIKSGKLQGEKEYLKLIKDEVNVKETDFDASMEEETKLDAKITPELKEEGDLRDLLRAIQDARKNANLRPGDVARLGLGTKSLNPNLVGKYKEFIKKTTSISEINLFDGEGIEIEK